jgi:uncharacterized membrane protein (DUF485 family)
MGMTDIFRKKKDFPDMKKPEKKTFLANDLIERMIRIEQRVRASFGEGVVPYYKTDYFVELTSDEKNQFKRYLERKEKRKKWWGIFLFALFFSGAIAGFRLTGDVIAEKVQVEMINVAILLGILVIVVLSSIYFLAKRKRRKRFDGHFGVLEHIIRKRNLKREKFAKA